MSHGEGVRQLDPMCHDWRPQSSNPSWVERYASAVTDHPLQFSLSEVDTSCYEAKK